MDRMACQARWHHIHSQRVRGNGREWEETEEGEDTEDGEVKEEKKDVLAIQESEKASAKYTSIYGQVENPSSFNVLNNQIRKQKDQRSADLEQQFL